MQVTVYKLDEEGREVWHYAGRVLERGQNYIRLEASFDRTRMDLGPVVFDEGDRFVETFYSDRWYNVFAVYAREGGQLKGWYCNICRPAEISEDTVCCEDLALDVWVDAEGRATILDEDEFAKLALSEEARRQSRAALSDILRLAENGCLPG